MFYVTKNIIVMEFNFFIGCSTNAVRVEYIPPVKSKYAPINNNEQYGLISYRNGKNQTDQEKRRGHSL